MGNNFVREGGGYVGCGSVDGEARDGRAHEHDTGSVGTDGESMRESVPQQKGRGKPRFRDEQEGGRVG